MKYFYQLLTFLCLCVAVAACQDTATSIANETDSTPEEVHPTPSESNPPAEGFNETGSSARAIAIADSVVWAYGGRKAYDNNRYFSWDFFGTRELLWDKKEKQVRIEIPIEKTTYLLDYENMVGRVQVDGSEVTEEAELAEALNRAKSIWINDSYWLVHQFKLKNSGVTLSYEGVTPVDPEKSRPSYIIDQTFEEVGDTPNNRYRLFIDQKTYKINTWQFFRVATDEEAAISTSWDAEGDFNGVILSANRGGRFYLGNISTPTKVAPERFTEF